MGEIGERNSKMRVEEDEDHIVGLPIRHAMGHTNCFLIIFFFQELIIPISYTFFPCTTDTIIVCRLST